MTIHQGMSPLRNALAAAERGWSVFPVRRCTGIPSCLDEKGEHQCKRPAITAWERRACRDLAVVRRAWSGRYARCNIGVACGLSGLVAIDLDVAADVDGIETFRSLATHREVPPTYTVRTPRGGRHLVFTAVPGRMIRNSAKKVGAGIDIRADGGYILAAGSAVAGKPYQLLDARDPAPLPAWIADLADPPKPARTKPVDIPTSSTSAYGTAALAGEVQRVMDSWPGRRNDDLNKSAFALGQLVAGGVLDQHDVHTALMLAAEAVGLGEREAERTIASGLRGGAKYPRGCTARPGAA